MQWCQAFVIALVDFSPHIQKVMYLQASFLGNTNNAELLHFFLHRDNMKHGQIVDCRRSLPTSRREGASLSRIELSASPAEISHVSQLQRIKKAYHINLLVGCCKMQRRPSSIVLGHKIRIGGHYLGKLLRVGKPDSAVKRDGFKLWLGRIPPGPSHISRHFEQNTLAESASCRYVRRVERMKRQLM